MQDRDTGLARISHMTYALHHNPNCPSPYLIITIGSAGRILGPGENGDKRGQNIHSYGLTLDHAVKTCLDDVAAFENQRRETRTDRERNERLRHVDRKYRGIVWG